jgi:hypothetical protein
MGSAGLKIIPNTASEGTKGEPVKRITATYADWPLVLTEFSTATALQTVGKFDPARKLSRGEAPYILVGQNIMVEFGPRDTNDPTPVPAEPAQMKALMALVAALDPLLGPLTQRSIQPVALPTPIPTPSPVPTPTPVPTPNPAGRDS